MKTQNKIKIWKVTAALLGIGCLFFGHSLKAEAAFPSNMNEKPMKISSIRQDEITVYKDAAREEVSALVMGDGMEFQAVDVSEDQMTLYGTYSNSITGEKGTGWMEAEAFVYDPAFKHVYATVRSSMEIYSGSSLSQYRDTIKKYSGIIALGKRNGAVQVVYDRGKSYGIGWMSAENYDNKLVYDGRDKQILADGTYSFATSTEASKEGVTIPPSQTYQITYLGKNRYRLLDVKQNQYLKLSAFKASDLLQEEDLQEPEWMEHGLKHTFKILFQPSYKEKVEAWEQQQEEKKQARLNTEDRLAAGEIYEDAENDLLYNMDYTENAEEASAFLLERQGDYFSIRWRGAELFFGNNEKQAPLLAGGEQPAEDFLWRVRAVKPLVDPKNPMVFTQYDPQWCGTSYGEEGCVGTAGCGLLATVNAVYALTGQYMSVKELMDYSVEKGYRIEGNGTDEGIFKAAATVFGPKYGFSWDGSSEKFKKLKKKLEQGDVAVSHVIGHYVAITAYDAEKDRYLLLDSNCLPKRETSAFGDWVSPQRLQDGYLFGQNYYYFKLEK